MRRYKVLTIVAGAVLCGAVVRAASAEDIGWYTDERAAWQAATEQQKPMFIFVSMRGCHYCREMQSKTFTDQRVSQRLNHAFVPLYVDGQANPEMVERLKVRAYPTSVVVAPDTQVMAYERGYRPAAKLRQTLDRVQQRDEHASVDR